jgi:hypothetical protein
MFAKHRGQRYPVNCIRLLTPRDICRNRWFRSTADSKSPPRGRVEFSVFSSASALIQTAGIDFGKLLPILAPNVLGLIAKKQGGAAGQAGAGTAAGGGGIGDIIGGLLGGGGSGGGSPAGGIDIGELLGGLLGGKR